MKASCTGENFKKALFLLDRVVGKQSSLPILSNILLETKNGQLQLSATNLEIGVVVSIGAKIEKEGALTVPAKILGAFIQNLPEGQVVHFETSGLELLAKSDRYQVGMKGLDTKDFPIIPTFTKEYQLRFPAQAIREAVQQVLFCVSLNESRAELTGVNIQFTEDSIVFAATDSFRLAEYRVSLHGNSINGYQEFRAQEKEIIVPAATLQELLRVVQPETEHIALAVDEHQLFLKIDETTIISRLLQGRFPEYRQILPPRFQGSATLKKNDFQRALKMVSSFSLMHSGEISLSIVTEKREIRLRSESQEIGRNEITLEYEGEVPEDIVFTFNPRYLLEGVGVLPSDTILFSWNAASSPVQLKDKNPDFPYFYIVMPIRK